MRQLQNLSLLNLSVIVLLVILTACSRSSQQLGTQDSTKPAATAHSPRAEDAHDGHDARHNATTQHEAAGQSHMVAQEGHNTNQAEHHHKAASNHDYQPHEHAGQVKHHPETTSRDAPHHSAQGNDSNAAKERDAVNHDFGGLNALQLFKRRITPILQAKNPSSCSECHLSGVDLKQYIGPDQESTFASLRAAGLIDMGDPDASKILTFINRRPERPSLLTDRVRKEEYAAFRAWIHAAVKDPKLAAAKTSDLALGPRIPDEVIRHARKDRVLASFLDNVWSEVGRCAACHSPDRNQKQVKEHGDQVSWIKLQDPQATLDYMLEAGIIDSDIPLESLLLKKPTLQVEHGGGQKMVVGDRTYKQFRRFIDDYASVINSNYASAASLPKQSGEISSVTEIWFKLTDVPAKYDQMLLQVDVHRWTDGGWSEHRVASSDRLVFGKGQLWQHSLSLTAQRGSKWANEMNSQRLLPGRYLVKVYIDQSGKLQKDFRAELGDDEFVGQIELESRWPKGYGNMTVARFPKT